MSKKVSRPFGSMLAWSLAILTCIGLSGCGAYVPETGLEYDATSGHVSELPANPGPDDHVVPLPSEFHGEKIPSWDGEHAYIELNGNEPWFSDADKARTDAFEDYSELDELGRCGVAYANICPELMPTEKRGEIGSVKPSGWHTVRYNDLIAGNYLYNSCHLIGYQLAGENANERNLITGTRYLNIEGMLPFEDLVDDYVDGTGNHVLYRVTPVYDGDGLVARGVAMEGWSVEDSGTGVRFCVFAYNNQPGIGIDYVTGESWRMDGLPVDYDPSVGEVREFVLNSDSGKFHKPDCQYVKKMAGGNRVDMTATVEQMLTAGYTACGACRPDE